MSILLAIFPGLHPIWITHRQKWRRKAYRVNDIKQNREDSKQAWGLSLVVSIQVLRDQDACKTLSFGWWPSPLHPFSCLVLNPGFLFRILSCSFHPNFNPRFGPRVPSVDWHNLYIKWTRLFSVFPWHTTGTCISVQKLDCGQVLEQGYSFTAILHPVMSNLRMATVSV